MQKAQDRRNHSIDYQDNPYSIISGIPEKEEPLKIESSQSLITLDNSKFQIFDDSPFTTKKKNNIKNVSCF